MSERANAVCLAITRLTLSAWVGAAVLFVVNGVRLSTSGAFDSVARDHIALIRFPPYYALGFSLVGISLLSLVVGRHRAGRFGIGLVATALVVMLADFFAVYRPLEGMVTPPGQPRTPAFETYHRVSMIINAVHVGLCFFAAVVLSCPRDAPANEK